MRKFLAVIMCVMTMATLLFAFLLEACSTNAANAELTYPLKIWKMNENGQTETWNLVDEDTGVNYVVVVRDTSGHGDGIAITPRLNADGSIYTSK